MALTFEVREQSQGMNRAPYFMPRKKKGIRSGPEYDWSRETWRQAVMWHGAAMLPSLRRLPEETLDAILQEAGELNLTEPLFYIHTPQLLVPSYSQKKLTGGQVTALLVFGLWVKCGESELAFCMLKDWPEIREAVFLCQ